MSGIIRASIRVVGDTLDINIIGGVEEIKKVCPYTAEVIRRNNQDLSRRGRDRMTCGVIEIAIANQLKRIENLCNGVWEINLKRYESHSRRLLKPQPSECFEREAPRKLVYFR